ncbi:MAG: DUF3187 family protein, partial [Gemmatimonadota bacterium]
MRRPLALLALIVAAGTPALAQGAAAYRATGADPCRDLAGPLSIVNDSPLRQPFLRPKPRSACPTRTALLEVRAGVANHFVDARDGARWALLDAETYRLELTAALPIGAGRELRVEVPFVARGEGLLDAPIEGWHALLGLPEGTRPLYPRNRIRLLVGSDELAPGPRVLLGRFDPYVTLGDVGISVAQRLPLGDERSAASVLAAIELPTGPVQELVGSGSAEVALGVG